MLNVLTRVVRSIAWLAMIYCVLLVILLGWPGTAWLMLLMGGLSWRLRGGGRRTDLGSARWATQKDLADAGMIGGNRGMILGRLPASTRGLVSLARRRATPLVRNPSAVHTAVFGPSGSGKGISFVLPELLTNPESCVVLDYKGELARTTAAHRAEYFGHRVVLLDPYHSVTGTPDTFNPIDFIPKGHALGIDDCNDLAASLVVRTGNERERHWDDSAEACIAAVAATVVAYGEAKTRSVLNVREIISHPKSFELATRLMTESGEWGGALAQMGGQLLHFTDREKASVLSSTLRHLRFLGTPAVAANTASSSFDPAELRRGKMTVFCILPPERARAQAGLLRMWVGAMLRACVREGLQ